MAPPVRTSVARFAKRVAIFQLLLASPLTHSYNLDLHAIGGQSAFEKGFLQEYEQAQRELGEQGSLTALIALTDRYLGPAEQAQLAIALGLAYSQQDGFVDFPKAVEHFTRALALDLPERNLIDVLMWRGSSYEVMKMPAEAMKDYLRGLVACSYHDLSREWPEIRSPQTPIYMNSADPANMERVLDYRRYRDSTDSLRHILRMKYFFVESVRRVQHDFEIDERNVNELLDQFTPDTQSIETVKTILMHENVRPWP